MRSSGHGGSREPRGSHVSEAKQRKYFKKRRTECAEKLRWIQRNTHWIKQHRSHQAREFHWNGEEKSLRRSRKERFYKTGPALHRTKQKIMLRNCLELKDMATNTMHVFWSWINPKQIPIALLHISGRVKME